uniref:Uncharacterized protein n=1 Tax=Oryza sativa subsp. japonica TaxID=39947 RepID=Q7EYQ5_ORYSJ|nr:hypothetical protein [Oryza sativa Japonica Group]
MMHHMKKYEKVLNVPPTGKPVELNTIYIHLRLMKDVDKQQMSERGKVAATVNSSLVAAQYP